MNLSGALKKLLISILIEIIVTTVMGILYLKTDIGIFLTLFVTFLTISYHFLMRVMVGESCTLFLKNHKPDAKSFWFRQHSFEPSLYKKLRVKRWKNHMITAKPEQFNVKERTTGELIFHTMQAELTHEIIMPLCFVPLLLIPRYGAAPVFVSTSILGCLGDSLFVVMQRFNRPRLMKLAERESRSRQ